ncbi:hypothetical protein ACFYTF_14705 [Nocardia thailandica]|uniref:Uncharacterized protein n=1 Tax=Nocardia thailandica TaxID=257275 RepID=A0ABW6PPA9_9NOCA
MLITLAQEAPPASDRLVQLTRYLLVLLTVAVPVAVLVAAAVIVVVLVRRGLARVPGAPTTGAVHDVPAPSVARARPGPRIPPPRTRAVPPRPPSPPLGFDGSGDDHTVWRRPPSAGDGGRP